MELTEQELQQRIDAATATAVKAAMLDAPARPLAHGAGMVTPPPAGEADALKAFGAWLKPPQLRTVDDAQAMKAQQVDYDTAGGYLTMPVEMSTRLIEAMDARLYIRQYATIERLTTAQSLGIPSIDGDFEDCEWTAELPPDITDDELTFGARELTPHPLRKAWAISNRLIQLSRQPITDICTRRASYRFGVTQEKHFLTGSGVNQPLGIFTPSENGVPTSRDVTCTAELADVINYDDIINTEYSIDEGYWALPGMAWIFHKNVCKVLRTLKDGQGRYIYEDSVKAGSAALPTLMGIPVYMSRFAPSDIETPGAYIGALCYLPMYSIVEVMGDMRIYVFTDSAYTRKGKTGYMGEMFIDGMPVLAEAFARIKLAAE